MPSLVGSEMCIRDRCYGARSGAVFRCREPYGAVRFYFMSYDAVRSGILCPTVRFGAVVRYRKTYRAVRCAFQAGKYAAVG